MSDVNRSSKLRYKVKSLSFEHIDGVDMVERACFSVPWSKQSFMELLSNPLAVYYVALDENTVVGYIGMYHILSEGQITNIAVLPEYRRQGIATVLFYQLMDYADREGLETLTLEVRNSNLEAKTFYDKYGFNEVGVRANYYSAPSENALLMTKNL